MRRGSTFARFEACSAYGIEVIAAESFLAPEARQELFEAALPLERTPDLARPAPVHALIILARLAWEEGGLAPKRRARLERIEAEDPGVWAQARTVGARWDELPRLDFLRAAADGGSHLPARHRLYALRERRPRRGVLVSLSGIDGCGKSSQARWLADAMTALGRPAEVVWNNLLGNASLDLIGRPVKRILRATGRGPAESLASYEEREGPPSAGALRTVWSSYVTVSNSLEQRVRAWPSSARGRVVIFDRGPLDLAVRMEVLYGNDAERHRRLVERAAPRPDLAFLLDITPAVSLGRKDDVWSPRQLAEQAATYRALAPRFGARTLDGGDPAHELAATIARATWLAG